MADLSVEQALCSTRSQHPGLQTYWLTGILDMHNVKAQIGARPGISPGTQNYRTVWGGRDLKYHLIPSCARGGDTFH